jgi:glucokinase
LSAEAPDVSAIGAGVAGIVNWAGGFVRWAPNSPLESVQLREILSSSTGLETYIDNDGNAAALGEARFGAGAGYRSSLAVTIGTGIGGGLFLDGAPYRGKNGYAGEIGHLIVQGGGDGAVCGCGMRGCWEAVASGTALARIANEVATDYLTSRLAAVRLERGLLTGEDVFLAAKKGDFLAERLFRDLGRWVGVGLGSLVSLLDPDAILLSGGIATRSRVFIEDALTSSYAEHVVAAAHRDLPPLLWAALGEKAGLVGAAALAMER